jgi:hypothetical protein
MARFFISYTAADLQWAEWIAWVLEDVGHETIIQKWDFGVGANFVVEMQRAAQTAERTIAVLSPGYVASAFTPSEWAAAFAQDPTGAQKKLVPVRVREFIPEGLFKSIVYIDLVGLDPGEARKRLIDGLNTGRAKPVVAPSFPGSAQSSRQAPLFPGPSTKAAAASRPRHIPALRRPFTDFDRNQFAKRAFEVIHDYFQDGLKELQASYPNLQFEFTDVSAKQFECEIFVNGTSESRCRISRGSTMESNAIEYAEGRLMRNGTINEALSVQEEASELAFNALMRTGFGRVPPHLNPERLSAEDAAEYLWRRFLSPLER